MIPKAQILEIATNQALLPTTVQKDYAIGWLLQSISRHPTISKWIFKGGTCLKKCYFETYRFSEDLDFTIPQDQPLNTDEIRVGLEEVVSWIESSCGLTFPRELVKIDEYENPRGKTSYQVKIAFRGPLGLSSKSLQRVKLDLTKDEVIADNPCLREIHSEYEDMPTPSGNMQCYTIEEILAEKTRALFERNGRARDVYDVVNISRNFRQEINPSLTKQIAEKKFHFKGIASLSVEAIISAIDEGTLRANWEHQLGHQLEILPPVNSFLDDLCDAIAWWLKPEQARPVLEPMPYATGNSVPKQHFPTTSWQSSPTPLDRIRYAARNNLCVQVFYHGTTRLVEPYSLRHPATGNEILHVWEVEKNGIVSEQQKSFKIREIESASVSQRTFRPKWVVEL